MRKIVSLATVVGLLLLTAVRRHARPRPPTRRELAAASYDMRVLGDRRHTGSITDAEYSRGRAAILERLGPY